MMDMKRVPTLRFPQFEGGWSTRKTKELFDRIADGVSVKQDEFYQQIGIRSYGKGLFHKIPVLGKTLGNKRVFWIKNNVLIINIVFAWEQAVAKTTDEELGMVASHRFPMFEPKKTLADLEYFLWFFLTKKGKYLLELASPGGAGRNKTLGQKTFDELNVLHPTLVEQQEIASFLSTVEKKIQQLTRKKELLEQYKKGLMQKIFSREIRFQGENGKDYPDWEEKRLGDVCECLDNRRIPLNRSQRQGMNGDIPYWGANNIMDYINEYIFDETIVLLAEDGGSFENFQNRAIANISHGKCWVNNHAHVLRGNSSLRNEFLFYSLVHKNILAYVNAGTRSKLNKSDMLQIKLKIPSLSEQQKIATFLSKIDKKIESVQTQLTQTKTFKKGLLQQMFV